MNYFFAGRLRHLLVTLGTASLLAVGCEGPNGEDPNAEDPNAQDPIAVAAQDVQQAASDLSAVAPEHFERLLEIQEYVQKSYEAQLMYDAIEAEWRNNPPAAGLETATAAALKQAAPTKYEQYERLLELVRRAGHQVTPDLVLALGDAQQELRSAAADQYNAYITASPERFRQSVSIVDAQTTLWVMLLLEVVQIELRDIAPDKLAAFVAAYAAYQRAISESYPAREQEQLP